MIMNATIITNIITIKNKTNLTDIGFENICSNGITLDTVLLRFNEAYKKSKNAGINHIIK